MGEPLEVAGTAWHQEELVHICRELELPARVLAELVPRDHPQDPNAIEVRIAGLLIGYIPRNWAQAMRRNVERRIARDGPLTVECELVRDAIGNVAAVLFFDVTHFLGFDLD